MDHEGSQGSRMFTCTFTRVSCAQRRNTQLSNDPALSSLPLLSTFLKAYARPYLGIVPPTIKQTSVSSESSPTTAPTEPNGSFPELAREENELVEKDVRDRFKR